MEDHQPNAEQIAAVRNFAARWGREWKSKLRESWMSGYPAIERQTGEMHLLQQVRNRFGSRWLHTFKL